MIYTLKVKKTAQAQQQDVSLKKFSEYDKYSSQLVNTGKEGKMLIPTALQHHTVSCYHHDLQHHGHTRLEETLCTTMAWKGMRYHSSTCQILSHMSS